MLVILTNFTVFRNPAQEDPFPRQKGPGHPRGRLFQPWRYGFDAERLRGALLPACQTNHFRHRQGRRDRQHQGALLEGWIVDVAE